MADSLPSLLINDQLKEFLIIVLIYCKKQKQAAYSCYQSVYIMNYLVIYICDVHYIENIIVKIRLKNSSQNIKSNVGPEINRHNNDIIKFFFGGGGRDL